MPSSSGLSDEGIENAIYDSQVIRGFVGIDLNRESAPDATTLLRFRRLLEKHELTRKIFDTINRHWAAQGLIMRERIHTTGLELEGDPRRPGRRDIAHRLARLAVKV